jgi:hypothetical protein
MYLHELPPEDIKKKVVYILGILGRLASDGVIEGGETSLTPKGWAGFCAIEDEFKSCTLSLPTRDEVESVLSAIVEPTSLPIVLVSVWMEIEDRVAKFI